MRKLFAIIILIIAFGCNKRNNNFEDNFQLIDSLSLHNKVLENVPFTSYHYGLGYKDTILTFRKDNQIIRYDFNSDSVKFRVSLNQFDSMHFIDHLYHNVDSIFICFIHNRTKEKHILLLNKNGEINKNWNISKNSEQLKDGYFYIDSKYLHPIVLLNNKLYFQASYRYKPGTSIKSEVPIEMMWNLSNNSSIQIGDLPSEYKKGDFYGNHQNDYSRTINKNNELIFSFPISNQLYVYNIGGELLKTVDCKSEFIDKIEPLEKKKYFDLSAIIDANIYNAQYNEIIYDSYNDRYYRIVLHKLNKYSDNGKVNSWMNRKWSLIILDKDFNIINEVLMPVNKFSKHIIVTDQGLLMRSIELENLYECYIFKLKEDAKTN